MYTTSFNRRFHPTFSNGAAVRNIIQTARENVNQSRRSVVVFFFCGKTVALFLLLSAHSLGETFRGRGEKNEMINISQNHLSAVTVYNVCVSCCQITPYNRTVVVFTVRGDEFSLSSRFVDDSSGESTAGHHQTPAYLHVPVSFLRRRVDYFIVNDYYLHDCELHVKYRTGRRDVKRKTVKGRQSEVYFKTTREIPGRCGFFRRHGSTWYF